MEPLTQRGRRGGRYHSTRQLRLRSRQMTERDGQQMVLLGPLPGQPVEKPSLGRKALDGCLTLCLFVRLA